MNLQTLDSPETSSLVPIWVPDPEDPDGLEGSWEMVDPASPLLDPDLAARALAVARLWATGSLSAVA